MTQNHGLARRWGECALAAAIGLGCLAYLADAWSTSSRTANLILILPATLIGVCLAAAIIIGELRRLPSAGQRASQGQESGADAPGVSLARIAGVVVLLTLFTAAIAYLPFDLATAAFTAATLLLLGERRILFVVLYSAAFSVILVWALKATLPYAVPSLLF